MVTTLALLIAIVHRQTGYEAYSNAPAMGWTIPGYILPKYGGRSGPYHAFSEQSWELSMSVTDNDQWKVPNSNPPSISTFGNKQVSIIKNIPSGSIYNDGDSYDATTGNSVFQWIITAPKVPAGTYLLRTDTFQAKDDGTIPLLNDGAGSVQNVYVRIDGS